MTTFVTSFEMVRRAEPCTYGYRKIARAMGGIKKRGKYTQIDLREILPHLGTGEAVWLFCQNGIWVDANYEDMLRVLTKAMDILHAVPCETVHKQRELTKHYEFYTNDDYAGDFSHFARAWSVAHSHKAAQVAVFTAILDEEARI